MEIDNIHGGDINSPESNNKKGVTYGYIRVSTIAQHDDRQRIAMEEFGIKKECLFTDKQSGKDFNRPAYNKMLSILKSGDTVVIKSLDRLGRDYEEMIHQLDVITREKNASIVVLDLPILNSQNKYGDDLTSKLVINIVIQIFSYVAQLEREMNHRRTMEGLAAAKLKGVKLGRKRITKPDNYEIIRERWEKGEIVESEAANILGVSRPTFHKWTHE